MGRWHHNVQLPGGGQRIYHGESNNINNSNIIEKRAKKTRQNETSPAIFIAVCDLIRADQDGINVYVFNSDSKCEISI